MGKHFLERVHLILVLKTIRFNNFFANIYVILYCIIHFKMSIVFMIDYKYAFN